MADKHTIMQTTLCIMQGENANYRFKPCPFCGGKPYFDLRCSTRQAAVRGWEFEIVCVKCRIRLPRRYKVECKMGANGNIDTLEDERQDAIDAWNRRAGNG